MDNNQTQNRTIPQQIHGTITIANGTIIQVNSDAVQSNRSTESSENFVKSLKKAIREGIFKKQDDSEDTK